MKKIRNNTEFKGTIYIKFESILVKSIGGGKVTVEVDGKTYSAFVGSSIDLEIPLYIGHDGSWRSPR